jgi:epsilon-lactone hydrolase
MSEAMLKIRNYMLAKKHGEASANKPLMQKRAEADAAMISSIKLPEGTTTENADAAGMAGLWVKAATVPEGCTKTVLYYHGGGFFSGSAQTHKGIAAAISEASHARVLVIDCRLAPEHPYPAAHEDAVAAYQWLLASGVAAKDIILSGDSAGAMLVLSTLQTLRDSASPLPAAAVLLSPWLDIVDFDGESYTACAELDPLVDAGSIEDNADIYFLTEENRKSTAPLMKDMTGLPPMLIQVGDQEVLLSDSLRLAEKAGAAGVDVSLEVWPGLWHVFQVLTAILPEAREAVEKIGEFILRF